MAVYLCAALLCCVCCLCGADCHLQADCACAGRWSQQWQGMLDVCRQVAATEMVWLLRLLSEIAPSIVELGCNVMANWH